MEVRVLEKLLAKIDRLRAGLATLKAAHPIIHEVRQCGLIAGIELRQADGTKFSHDRRIGEKVCIAARAHGLLTRPILDTIVLMPPLCVTEEEIDFAIRAIGEACRISPFSERVSA